ncbi:MAG TPA: sensor of ECF-type sigma factor [Flavobacterium sp.]|jgi:Spy/CpxP family protein refolding chaperone
MKKKIILTITVIFLMSVSAFAQAKRGEKAEQVRSLKVAFITKELSLTSDEAQKFWPLYNAYEEKQRILRRQKNGILSGQDAAIDKISDKEAAAALNQMEKTEDEIYQQRKKFAASLRDVLPPIKIIKLKKAEEDFSRKLLKQYRERTPRR